MSKKEKQYLSEFIDLYRSFPCLWKIKSKQYSDRNMKSQVYEVMAEKMREFDPEANRESVVKKINTLRTAYRRELKKVVDSERSGVGEEEVYIPHLWYFDLLNFIRDQEISRKTRTNVEDQNESEHVSADPELISEPSPISPTSPNLQSISPPPTPLSSGSHASISTSRTTAGPTRTAKRQIDKCDEVLHAIGKHFEAPTAVEDKFALIGKTWAMKLRDLPSAQALYAEKIINEVFFAAEMKKLTPSCTFQIPTSQSAKRPPQNQTYPQQTQTYQQNVQYHQQHFQQGQPWSSSFPLRPPSSQSLLRTQSLQQQTQQLPEETDLQLLHSQHETIQYEQERQLFLEQECFRKETDKSQVEEGSVANYFQQYKDV